ncbi:DNRLRE domain-containing protein [Clostridium sp. HV4-5-A1G]|uniref:DNRLRE domain-containing protein n=1 Tax=Clostridium sp. HV4-5-A1G TaxID=2004595 RepID=UPI00123ACAB4|nr:DNRLRE domain-containing protein [Clostridium sp. HV4-5-A1G]KAA8669665.1 DNRLRE domain-containing protein [Clostridium sp. HV4-5-A1G]
MSYIRVQSICVRSLTITDFKPKSNVINDTLKIGFDGKNIYRSYMYFNIDNIPKDEFVNSAYLYIYLNKIDTEHSRTVFYIQPLQEDFDKYTTFEKQPQYYNRQAKFEINKNFHGPVRVEITDIFNEWNSGYMKNKGIIMKSNERKKSLGSFTSNSICDYEFIPKLIISIPELNHHNNSSETVNVMEKSWNLEFRRIRCSPPINVERIIQGTFFIDNIGNGEVKAAVEVSCDLCSWIKDDEIIVDSNSSGILVAKYYGKYYRVKLQCLEQGTVRVNFIYQAYR